MFKQKLHVNNVLRWPNLTKINPFPIFPLFSLNWRTCFGPNQASACEKLKIKLNKKIYFVLILYRDWFRKILGVLGI